MSDRVKYDTRTHLMQAEVAIEGEEVRVSEKERETDREQKW